MFCHSLRAFLLHEGIRQALVVIGRGEQSLYEAALRRSGIEGMSEAVKLLPPREGGANRQESVRAGLEALENHAPEKILIHDAARPMVAGEEISACLQALKQAEAVVPVLPVDDALKHCGSAEDLRADLHHVPREEYRRALTPQGFDYAALLRAHREFPGASLPDDAALMEKAGVKALAIAAKRGNFKVTHSEDFARAEAAIHQRDGGHSGNFARVGWGFDAHRLVAEKSLRLCGVDIAHEFGLEGHSDADVGLHALTDAIFGALAAGDMGEHFPPHDARWRNADSSLFLAHASDMAQQAGFRIEHVDVTLICEAPKIAPHRQAMRKAVADILNLTIDNVSIKATSTEGMGFPGRGEGIAAQAVATLSRRGG